MLALDVLQRMLPVIRLGIRTDSTQFVSDRSIIMGSIAAVYHDVNSTKSRVSGFSFFSYKSNTFECG